MARSGVYLSGTNLCPGCHRDVSKRVQAEHQLQQRVVLRAHEQSALLEISQNLVSTLELQPGLILDQLGVLIKYTHASLFTLEDSTLVAMAMRGRESLERSVPFRIRLNGKQTLEALFNGHQPIRIADIWNKESSSRFLRTLLENDALALLIGKAEPVLQSEVVAEPSGQVS
jgi:hypothetical protein